MPLLNRLRWQLTLSHLAAIAVTLVLMVLAVFLVATSWLSAQGGGRDEVHAAQVIGRAVGGMVVNGAPEGELNAVLRALVAGQLRVLSQAGAYAPEQAASIEGGGPSLGAVRYAAVLAPDGRVLASSDAAGAGFAPPDRHVWAPVVDAALATGWSRAVRTPDGGLLDVSPIVGPGGRLVAVAIAAQAPRAGTSGGSFNPLRTLAFFGIATAVVLAAASVFALVAASLVGYLLSRRLVRRIEALSTATEALAAGDLSRRVDDRGGDEVGQLARRFNAMGEKLCETIGELEKRRTQAEGLLRARRELVANVSHELRTPVATARGYLESALRRDGAVPGDLRRDLETVQREVARLERLIGDLFTLSRAEVGQLELRVEPTDVAALVRRLVETTGALAWRGRRVEVLAEVEGAVPPARVDPERLEQAVSNLIGNAVRHTPPGGLVAVVVDVDTGAVRVRVRDTGEGIPADELPRVFERFYRGSAAEPGDGAGLGLALVKELVETMGGTVEAESTPGQGSCFALRLPPA